MNQCQEEMKKAEAQILGLQGFKVEVSDFVNSLGNQDIQQAHQLIQKKKQPAVIYNESYEDSNSMFKKKAHTSIGKTQVEAEEDKVYQQKREELQRINQRVLDAGNELEQVLDLGNHDENYLVKKTLSIIYSTDESIDTSSQINRNQSRQNTESDNYKSIAPDSFRSSNLPTERENFLSLLHMIKYKYKDNKDLSESLYKLMDVYNKEVNKYEENIIQLTDKAKKCSHANELLIKTLKTFEQELDKLAINNQTLHKNILYLQDQIKNFENKEKNQKDFIHQQDRAFNLLKEELRHKVDELEETKNKLIFSNSKIDSLSSYAQSCEDSISFVSQTLKQSLGQKTGGKVTAKQIYSILETIYTGISKFQEKGNFKMKIDESMISLGSRKNSDFLRSEDELFNNTGNVNLSSRRDTRSSNSSTSTFMEPKISTKILSKSIDLSLTRKYSLNNSSMISNRSGSNRQRQHSLVDTSTTSGYKDTFGRGRSTSRNKSVEKVVQRSEKSAPMRKYSHTPTQSKRPSKNILEAEIEDSFRKRLIENIKHK